MDLSNTDFAQLIASAPLVSIDLIVRDDLGNVLLGYRRNRPAQNYWFVPGGRVRKNESLRDALSRIANMELGTALPVARFLGPFEHFYDDNFFDIPELSTHYIVMAFECTLPKDGSFKCDKQHSVLQWWSIESLLLSEQVHQNTKAYFLAREPHHLDTPTIASYEGLK